jgi:SSS family solute:Na+ symporter
MELMKAKEGDLVYVCDARKYLGGLKSVHLIYGEAHEEDGIVYLNNEALLNGVFEKNKKLTAEKEM